MTGVTVGEPDDLVLAAEFPAATRQQWQRLVAKVIGVDGDVDSPERQLATVTGDGIEIEPLYVADGGRPVTGYPGQPPFVRGRGPPATGADGTSGSGMSTLTRRWPASTSWRTSRAASARSGWALATAGSRSSRCPTCSRRPTSTWRRSSSTPVRGSPRRRRRTSTSPPAAACRPARWPAAWGPTRSACWRGPASSADAGAGQADPNAATPPNAAGLTAAVDLARRCAADFPGIRAIVVDALPYHEAGGTDAEELGCALAAGLEYLRAMRAAGLPAEAAFGQLEFRYAATADQFATIAKLRAARRVWARVAQQCGVTSDAGGQWQHAVSSWSMLTRRDPWNNILRATLACFAAGVGGADAITVAPFDAAIGQPDRLARRVARNVHALLVEESHAARVIDPAGGSWYVEDLTDQLAVKAWAWFQEIERSGGLRAALATGLIAGRLAASREQRRDALATRREAVTGVSEFPLVGETLLSRPAAAGPAVGPAGLPRIRWSQWHEELRDRADVHALATGSPPTITLAPLDGSRASVAQADRVTALLAPAGIKTVTAAMPMPMPPLATTPYPARPRLSSSAEAPTPARTRSAPPWTGPANRARPRSSWRPGTRRRRCPAPQRGSSTTWTCWRSSARMLDALGVQR